MFRLSFLLLLICTFDAFALQLDLPEHAERLDKIQAQQGLHRLALGRAREVNSRWQFEQEQFVKGEQTAITWQLDNAVNYQSTVRFFADWVAQTDAEVVYQCQGRSCGASNIWANNYFFDWRLYGPDDKQYFWLLRQGNEYFMLYLIERGNRKVYLREQKIITEQNLTAKDNLILGKQCQTDEIVQLDQQAHWLLIVSVVNDQTQQQSRKLAEQCLTRIKQAEPKLHIDVLALGQWNRHWQKVQENYLELIRTAK